MCVSRGQALGMEANLLLQCLQGMVPQSGGMLLDVPGACAVHSPAWCCAATAHTLEVFVRAAARLVRQQDLSAFTLGTLYALQVTDL